MVRIRLSLLFMSPMIISNFINANPLPNDNDSKDCRVRNDFIVSTPSKTVFYIYIAKGSSFQAGFDFIGKDRDRTRDGVVFNNNMVTHSKIRNGISKTSTWNLPQPIRKGWNTIMVSVANKSITVTLILPEGGECLLTLPFDYEVEEMAVKGNFTLCSKAREFDVPEGKEVDIPLSPDISERTIELTPGNSTDAYFKFPGRSEKYRVPSKSTLVLITSLQGDHFVLKVLEIDEGACKEVGNNTAPINSTWSLVVGGAKRAKVLDEPGHCNNSSAAPTIRDTSPPANTCMALGISGLAVGIIVLMAVMGKVCFYPKLKKRCGKNSNDNTQAPDEDGSAQIPLMNLNNNGITKKFSVLVHQNDVSCFANTLVECSREGATIYVHTTTTNEGQDITQHVLCSPDNLNNLKNSVRNQVRQRDKERPELIDFTGTMEQKKWQALQQRLKDNNFQIRELKPIHQL